MGFCCNHGSSNVEPTGSLLSKREGFGFNQTTEAPSFKDSSYLSVKDRERAYNQLHCVEDEPAEDPEAVQRGLHELDRQIDMLKRKKSGSAYQLAEEQNEAYVEDRKFRLMFLRAEQYDKQQAALRIMRFFDEKLRLFGKEKLTKDILYEDLSEADRESLECGSLQICPLKDRAGRRIYVGLDSRKKYKEVANYVRAQFYLLMSLLEDESVQLKGINFVLYKDTMKPDRDLIWQTSVMRHAIPLRVPAGHCCMQDRRLRALIQLGASLNDAISRSAYRFHFGAHTECLYALMGFGIPVFALPFAREGEFDVDNHRQWIEKRKAIDSQKSEKIPRSGSQEWAALLHVKLPKEGIDQLPVPRTMDEIDSAVSVSSDDLVLLGDSTTEKHPKNYAPYQKTSNMRSSVPKTDAIIVHTTTHTDVLLGRGKPLQRHPGNVIFRNLVAARIDVYEKASKRRKTKIAAEVIELVKQSSGRFLKPAHNQKTSTAEGGEWEEIDNHTARLKVASTFRTVRKVKKRR